MVIHIYGGVKVSTGILRYSKRAEVRELFKTPQKILNANNNKLALAA